MTEEVKNTESAQEPVKAGNKKGEAKAKTEAVAKEGRKGHVEKVEHPSGDFTVEHL